MQSMNVDGIDLTSNGPSPFMSLLNDGSFDINALFNPGDFGFVGTSMIAAPSPIDRGSRGLRIDGSSEVAVSPS